MCYSTSTLLLDLSPNNPFTVFLDSLVALARRQWGAIWRSKTPRRDLRDFSMRDVAREGVDGYHWRLECALIRTWRAIDIAGGA